MGKPNLGVIKLGNELGDVKLQLQGATVSYAGRKLYWNHTEEYAFVKGGKMKGIDFLKILKEKKAMNTKDYYEIMPLTGGKFACLIKSRQINISDVNGLKSKLYNSNLNINNVNNIPCQI